MDSLSCAVRELSQSPAELLRLRACLRVAGGGGGCPFGRELPEAAELSRRSRWGAARHSVDSKEHTLVSAKSSNVLGGHAACNHRPSLSGI